MTSFSNPFVERESVEINSVWIANWNDLEYRVTRVVGGDVFVERDHKFADGLDARMIMIEKFLRSFRKAALDT